MGVRGLLAECMELVRAGVMPLRTANTIAVLANAQKAYHELTDISERLTALEEGMR